MITTRVISKCKTGKNSKHFPDDSFFIRLKEDLQEHLFSIESKTRADSIVLIEKRMDYKKDPVIVSLALDKNIKGEPVHVITSMYGRKEFAKWIEASLKANCRIYENAKKEKFPNGIGLQLPRQVEISLSVINYNIEIEKKQGKKEQNMEKQQELQFEAFVANLRKYSEGDLVGEWVGFPAEKEELDAVLERIGINEDYEEYFITEYDWKGKACFEEYFGEYEHMSDLNLLGALLEKYGLEEKTEGYLAYQSDISKAQLFNTLAQQDSISYHTYDFDGVEHLKVQDRISEELYGYTIAAENGTYKKLCDMDMESYVDFEAYGRDQAINNGVELMDHGYVDVENTDIDPECYSLEDLMEQAGLSMNQEADKAVEQTMGELVPRI